MSASSKKKLRKEQAAAAMTEKQLAEQKEAKKLKIYSITFIVVMALVVVTALSVMAVKTVQNSGIIEKNTVAAVVGDHKVNSVEMRYYYSGAIDNFYNYYYSMYSDSTETMLNLMGLDLSKPLNEQTYPQDETMTWADYFVDAAMDNLKHAYILSDMAEAEGFELSEDDLATVDSELQTLSLYGMIYGYSDVDQYLSAMYGHGATEKTYRAYSERNALANAYYNAYNDGLSYDDAAIREHDEANASDYTSYTYASYYLSYNKFLGEGTEDEEGNVTYTDAENEQARADAKAAAESLLTATDVDALDTAIAALAINAESTSAASTKSTDTMGSSVSATYKDWITAAERQANDITVIPYETTSEDADGNETTVLNGYYVVLFQSANDNTRPLSNVRHLLVQFEGGTTDDDGNTTYSDEEKAAAKAEAEGYLADWAAGDATEESFIELVKEHSDDTSAEDGGLFEDITPTSNYVENFLNWSIDLERQTGDTAVIETEYGYHVMYYVGNSDINYRDYMITEDLRAEDLEEWYNAQLETQELTVKSLKHLDLDRIISPASES